MDTLRRRGACRVAARCVARIDQHTRVAALAADKGADGIDERHANQRSRYAIPSLSLMLSIIHNHMLVARSREEVMMAPCNSERIWKVGARLCICQRCASRAALDTVMSHLGEVELPLESEKPRRDVRLDTVSKQALSLIGGLAHRARGV